MRLSAVFSAACVLVSLLAPASASQREIDAGDYRKYSCAQLLEKGRQVSARAAAVAHDLEDARTNETASAEDSVVIPSVLASAKPIPGELGILKQKLSAIQDATIQSQCQIEFRGSGK